LINYFPCPSHEKFLTSQDCQKLHYLKDILSKYDAVIGLEVHVQLNTESKLFSSDPNRFGAAPNHNVSVISLGHPGSLPRLNTRVVRSAISMGLATGSEIASSLVFARKNYFYTDLPKGYQISQHESPICEGGSVWIRTSGGGSKEIRLTRIHIEEDAGKSLHDKDPRASLIDLNRAGVPLLEIVSEPDLSSGEEAALYLSQIRRLVRYLDISDGNMEEGSMRCDANVSLKTRGDPVLGTRCEIKNLNSISNVRRAVEIEISRQAGILDSGGTIVQQTLGFDDQKNGVFPLRDKEEADDYRYFPEPDLNPLPITQELIAEISSAQPALPDDIFGRLTGEYKLPAQDAEVVTESPEFANYFLKLAGITPDAKAAANWMLGPVKAWLNENNRLIGEFPLTAGKLASLIRLVEDGKVSYSSARQKLFPRLIGQPSADPEKMATALDLLMESGEDIIMKQVMEALDRYPEKIREYHRGKKGLVGLFMGEVMKISGGRADPKAASRLIKEELNKRK
jgi:aspartyl-tRNA(Asn)/glutamyl-tRNA(Gln) amidotransferase subunit B